MRYILNDEGYIETISFGNEITCNDKTCTEYTGIIPDGYSSLGEWSETAIIQAYKIVDGNLTYDSEKETALIKEWSTYKDPKIVYEISLSENTNTIEVTGLDMETDGGEYEFELIHAENTTDDVQITFNDITVGYYQQGVCHGGALSSSGELTTSTFFRKAMDRIYYATGGTTTMQFPAIMNGRFLFSSLTRKAVYYELKNIVVLNDQQVITELYGVNDQPVENLTSIKFAKLTGAYFLAGTRLIIKKK